jgi:hypothetical protein
MVKARYGALALLCMGAFVFSAGSAAAQCRIPQRFPGQTAASMTFNSDVNANLGDWGSIFLDADTVGCEVTARDFLKTKLQQQNLDANGWKGGLRGGDVYLVTAAALRLGGRGLLTSSIHTEVLKALASYDFANWGGPCGGRSSANGCMDDYTVAAAGHAWAGTYLWFTQSTTQNPYRDAAWFWNQSKSYLKLSFSPQDTLCVHPFSPTTTACAACSDNYSTKYLNNTFSAQDITDLRNAINNQAFGGSDSLEVLSFEHNLETPNYGAGLLTSVGIAMRGLQVGGSAFVPTDFQKVMARGLFRTAQYHATSTTNACQATWLSNCVGLSCSMAGHCISGTCAPPPNGCAESAPPAYEAGMYPIRKLIDDNFSLGSGNDVILGTGYQFNGFCASKFSSSAGFFHDGRYAAYYQIPYQWAVQQPWVWGVSPAQAVDAPQSSTPVHSGANTFSGWAFDGEAGATLTTANFSFKIDGSPVTLTGFAYGGWRNDVCSTTGVNKGANCPVGWSGTYTPSGLSTGPHTFQVIVTSANGQSVSNFNRNFTYQP